MEISASNMFVHQHLIHYVGKQIFLKKKVTFNFSFVGAVVECPYLLLGQNASNSRLRATTSCLDIFPLGESFRWSMISYLSNNFGE